MLEIVERILAALIILALLTLLIILAFPVPPRQTAGPPTAAPKPGEVADTPAPARPAPRQTAEPVPPPAKAPEQPAPAPQPDVAGDSAAQREADRRAEENRRRAEAEALRHKRAVQRAECSGEGCGRGLRTTHIRDCPEGGCPRRPIRRPVLKDCPDGARDCCPEERRHRYVKRNNLPYWKDPRYAVSEDDPDWYDERIAAIGPPPGACPD